MRFLTVHGWSAVARNAKKACSRSTSGGYPVPLATMPSWSLCEVKRGGGVARVRAVEGLGESLVRNDILSSGGLSRMQGDHKDCAVFTTGKVRTLGMTLGVDRGPAQMGEMEDGCDLYGCSVGWVGEFRR